MKSLIIALMLPLSLIAEAPFGGYVHRVDILGHKSETMHVLITWSLEAPKHPYVLLEKENGDGIEFATPLLMTEEMGSAVPADPFSAKTKQIAWVSSVVIGQGDLERVTIRLSDGKSSSLADLIKAYPTSYD